MDVLIVDGYNMIGAWDELERLKRNDLKQARNRLIEILVEYRAYSKERVIIVFDALYVKGKESRKVENGVELIYTKEGETADECIERLVKSVKNIQNKVYVATSDYLEQRTIFGRGALRLSARELKIEIDKMNRGVQEEIIRSNHTRPQLKSKINPDVWKQLEKWRRGNISRD